MIQFAYPNPPNPRHGGPTSLTQQCVDSTTVPNVTTPFPMHKLYFLVGDYVLLTVAGVVQPVTPNSNVEAVEITIRILDTFVPRRGIIRGGAGGGFIFVVT